VRLHLYCLVAWQCVVMWVLVPLMQRSSCTTAPVAEATINGSVTAAALHIVCMCVYRAVASFEGTLRDSVPAYRSVAYYITTYHACECTARWSVSN